MEEIQNNKKLSYDELKQIAGELHQENQQLNMMLQQANMTNTFKHMDYMFKVLELKDCFDSEFVITCADKIKELLTPPTEEEMKEAADGQA